MHSDHSDWKHVRRLLWNDDEHVLIAKNVRRTGPMQRAGDISAQPSEPFCCANGFKPSSKRAGCNVERWHTWVIEHDDMPLEKQREMWEQSDLPHSLRVFSGGKSVHVFIRVDEDIGAEQWRCVASGLEQAFPFADKKVLKDSARLCRMPGGTRDGGMPQAIEYAGERVSLAEVNAWVESKGVHRYIGTEIQSTEKNVLASTPGTEPDIQLRKGVRESDELEEHYRTMHPNRFAHYQRFVTWRVHPKPHERNGALVATVPVLFTAVCRELAMEFVDLFYRLHAYLWNDSLIQHMSEAESLWRSLEEKYPERLTDTEREWYGALTNERRKAAFRIARSLALDVEADGLPTGLFIMPRHEWSVRLNCKAPKVQSIASRFERRYGLIETVRKGFPHSRDGDGKGKQGRATVYRWKGGYDLAALDEQQESEAA